MNIISRQSESTICTKKTLVTGSRRQHATSETVQETACVTVELNKYFRPTRQQTNHCSQDHNNDGKTSALSRQQRAQPRHTREILKWNSYVETNVSMSPSKPQ